MTSVIWSMISLGKMMPRSQAAGASLPPRALLRALHVGHVVVLGRRGRRLAEEAQLHEGAQHALDRAVLDAAVRRPLPEVDHVTLVSVLQRLARQTQAGFHPG